MDEPQNETKCSQLLKKECEEFCFSFRYFVGPHFLLRHSRGRGADEKHEHYAHASLAGSPIVFNLRSFFYILFKKVKFIGQPVVFPQHMTKIIHIAIDWVDLNGQPYQPTLVCCRYTIVDR